MNKFEPPMQPLDISRGLLTFTSNGQVLVYGTPFFLVLGILCIVIGICFIWLWIPKN